MYDYLWDMGDSSEWWWWCVSGAGHGWCVSPLHQPFAFVVARYTITAISIAITIVSAYVVLNSRSVTRLYSTMLVLSLEVWMSVDIVVQWLGDPYFLFAVLCVQRRTESNTAPISAFTGSAIVQSLIMFGVVVYIALFIYRHQLIALPGSIFKFPLYTRIIFLALLLIPYLGIGPLLHHECSSIAVFSRHQIQANRYKTVGKDRVDYYPVSPIYNSLLIFDGIFALVFILIIARHTFALIGDAKDISPALQRLHRVLTRSLIFQALTPFLFIIIPISIASITQYVFSQPSDVPTKLPVLPFDISLLVFAFHATVHSVVLIGTTPAFRAKLIQMLTCLIPRRIAPAQHEAFAGQSAYASFTGASSAVPQE